MNGHDFTKISIEDATSIPEKDGFYKILRNRYWQTTDDDCILLYKGFSPQCNKHKSIVESIMKKQTKSPATNIKFLDKVFLKIDPQDYC